MKRTILNLLVVISLSLVMTSCYTLTYNVGNGAQTGVEITERNHYFVLGLASVKTSNPIQMAGNAKDYTVTTEITFIDGLIAALTAGIYTPTTTKITK